MFILPKIAFHFMSYCVLRARAYLTEITAVLLAVVSLYSTHMSATYERRKCRSLRSRRSQHPEK